MAMLSKLMASIQLNVVCTETDLQPKVSCFGTLERNIVRKCPQQ